MTSVPGLYPQAQFFVKDCQGALNYVLIAIVACRWWSHCIPPGQRT
jgi:hypothetical protein